MFNFFKKAAPPPFQATVTDPQKNGEGMSQYISYKINVTATEDGQSTQSTTVRRYRDFAWLHNVLFADFPGALIPPLPEKGLIGRFTDEFIRERQLALETFLKRVIAHKDLVTHRHVKTFLMGDDTAFAEACEEKIQGRGRAESVQATVNQVVNQVQTMINGNKNVELTPDELAIEELMGYVNGLEGMLTPAMKTYDSLAKSSNDTVKTWVALGAACKQLSETETEGADQVLSEVLARLDIASERSADVSLSSFDPETVELRRKLTDCMRMLKAVKAMVKAHFNANLAYKKAVATVKAKQAKLESSPEQSEVLIAQIEEAKTKEVTSKTEVDKLAALAIEEAASFRQKKMQEFVLVIEHFAKIQIDNNRQLTKAWSALLPCLEAKVSGPI